MATMMEKRMLKNMLGLMRLDRITITASYLAQHCWGQARRDPKKYTKKAVKLLKELEAQGMAQERYDHRQGRKGWTLTEASFPIAVTELEAERDARGISKSVV